MYDLLDLFLIVVSGKGNIKERSDKRKWEKETEILRQKQCARDRFFYFAFLQKVEKLQVVLPPLSALGGIIASRRFLALAQPPSCVAVILERSGSSAILCLSLLPLHWTALSPLFSEPFVCLVLICSTSVLLIFRSSAFLFSPPYVPPSSLLLFSSPVLLFPAIRQRTRYRTATIDCLPSVLQLNSGERGSRRKLKESEKRSHGKENSKR